MYMCTAQWRSKRTILYKIRTVSISHYQHNANKIIFKFYMLKKPQNNKKIFYLAKNLPVFSYVSSLYSTLVAMCRGLGVG